MKKGIIVATALIGIAGGFAIGQTELFGSAQKGDYITAAEAKKIALQQFDGTVIEYDFDKDDRTPHYEFEIQNDTEEVEVEVNALNGEAKITEQKMIKAKQTNGAQSGSNVVANSNANDSASTNTENPAEQTLISKSQAIAIAQAKADGTVTKAELDTDNGIQVYEIEIKNGKDEYDFEIDAETGNILEFEVDYDN